MSAKKTLAKCMTAAPIACLDVSKNLQNKRLNDIYSITSVLLQNGHLHWAPPFWRQKSCTKVSCLLIKFITVFNLGSPSRLQQWNSDISSDPIEELFFYCKIVFIIELFTFLWIKKFLLLELYWRQLQQIFIFDRSSYLKHTELTPVSF